ncbi:MULTISPECIES: AAA family ATPase [unclassified Shewanella]|uniref:AAA family ATPase n=1 Tax=unclassified Shewanella TaxID=196818 RepID=UPI000C4EB18D|nr:MULTISPECIES: AAA family ATPase [unclassified Shewanella]PIP98559.1 MAG: type II restriction endonuclease subunit R [Shewanella sp. CG18_big_fil_WC_8_21_14_2_50_42_11]PIY64736.1 MAG: type II restriction endonuclease subunit R [Shewanella sp. CG_4_10_14_0_8_um_filter_42_13]
MFDKRIDEFVMECKALDDLMDFSYLNLAPSISFSNTGRRGQPKYFSISLIQLTTVFENILNNYNEFRLHQNYVEDDWRRLFSEYLSDDIVNALSTVQTLPLFSVINKVNHIINEIEEPFTLRTMALSIERISNVIVYLKKQIPNNEKYIESITSTSTSAGENIIYYGAPGTGKSHKIDGLATDGNSIRTVFHSETQYSDFVGCLKPCMVDGDISYQFRPGPFSLALVKAASDEQQCFLVIEEINRAAAAAVFGDIFQLLDRRTDGRSQYSIDVVDADFKGYLETRAASLLVNGKLILPANLSLLATMNSSDQAVMPMDSAFKRRWQFEYVSIEGDVYPRGDFVINVGTELFSVSWEVLSKVINAQLSEAQIPEDRLLGPWFISEKELENSQGMLAGKLSMYLWEDVLRHAHREVIFDTEKNPTLYQLIKTIKANGIVFSDVVINELRANGKPITAVEA